MRDMMASFEESMTGWLVFYALATEGMEASVRFYVAVSGTLIASALPGLLNPGGWRAANGR